MKTLFTRFACSTFLISAVWLAPLSYSQKPDAHCVALIEEVISKLDELSKALEPGSLAFTQTQALLNGSQVLEQLVESLDPQLILVGSRGLPIEENSGFAPLAKLLSDFVHSHPSLKSASEVGKTHRKNLAISPLIRHHLEIAAAHTGRGKSILVTDSLRLGIGLMEKKAPVALAFQNSIRLLKQSADETPCHIELQIPKTIQNTLSIKAAQWGSPREFYASSLHLGLLLLNSGQDPSFVLEQAENAFIAGKPLTELLQSLNVPQS